MTSSAIDPVELARCRRRVFLALFTALAVALHTLEFLLPAPAPWFRLGFANILTLCALFLFDGRAAWTLSLARVLVGSLILGNLFAPGFFLSLAGAVAATALMTGARALFGARLGPVGASALGAVGHALGQLLVAWLLLVRHDGLWLLLPFFLLLSLGTGLLNGWVAALLIEAVRDHRAFAKPLSAGRLP
ncbi:Gx transporter family protein [Geoalkalibacter sp.]|uniref:Gx transporter family protein n=1 Tax=Geoalkalibacter sp. TaxID=3041440 RepID=UPI00272ECC4A|nr:Gx transporter family protein [Geoalkalibacter sp.]